MRLRTIYQKEGTSPVAVGDVHLIKNVGREQFSFVTHIVRNYNHLAQRTVFMHAASPSCGFFRAGGRRGGHLLANVSALDYLDHPFHHTIRGSGATGGGGFFAPITMAFDRTLELSSLRSSFAELPFAQQQVARPVSPFPRGGAGDHWLPWERNNFSGWVQEQAVAAGRVDFMTFEYFWDRVFGRLPPEIIVFAQGAQLAASPEALRHTALPTYEWLLEELSQGTPLLVGQRAMRGPPRYTRKSASFFVSPTSAGRCYAHQSIPSYRRPR